VVIERTLTALQSTARRALRRERAPSCSHDGLPRGLRPTTTRDGFGDSAVFILGALLALFLVEHRAELVKGTSDPVRINSSEARDAILRYAGDRPCPASFSPAAASTRDQPDDRASVRSMVPDFQSYAGGLAGLRFIWTQPPRLRGKTTAGCAFGSGENGGSRLKQEPPLEIPRTGPWRSRLHMHFYTSWR